MDRHLEGDKAQVSHRAQRVYGFRRGPPFLHCDLEFSQVMKVVVNIKNYVILCFRVVIVYYECLDHYYHWRSIENTPLALSHLETIHYSADSKRWEDRTILSPEQIEGRLASEKSPKRLIIMSQDHFRPKIAR